MTAERYFFSHLSLTRLHDKINANHLTAVRLGISDSLGGGWTEEENNWGMNTCTLKHK